MHEIVLEGNQYRGHFRGNPSTEIVEHRTEYRDDTRQSHTEYRDEHGFSGEAKIEDIATGKRLAVFSFETDTDQHEPAFKYALLGGIAYAPQLRRVKSGSQSQLVTSHQIALEDSREFIGKICRTNNIGEEDLYKLVVDKTLENMVEECNGQEGRWTHTITINYHLQLNHLDLPRELGLLEP